MNDFDFTITTNYVVHEDDEVTAFAKAKLEYQKREKYHEEYMKKKQEQEVLSSIKHDKRMEKYYKKKGFPAYETESDDSDYSEKKKDVDIFPGEWVQPFAYLVTMFPYNFQQYVPLSSNNVTQKKLDRETVWISEQHVPVGKGISEKYVWDRLKFLNQTAESTKDPLFIVSIISYKFKSIILILVYLTYIFHRFISRSKLEMI